MYIEKITINSFGQLSGREFTLSPGVNIFEGENETGKSTIASFIRFMLYGVKDKSAARRYINWNETSASGSMIVSTGTERVLIERSAALAGDGSRETVRERVRMTDVETGLELWRGKCPGEVIFGVPEDVFLGTAFVRQIGARIDGERMSAAAENLLFSADEAVNTERAAKKIDEVRRGLLHKNGKGGAIYEKAAEIDALNERLENAKKSAGELIVVEASIADLELAREAAIEKRDLSRKRAQNYETVRNWHKFEQLAAMKSEASSLVSALDEMGAEGDSPDAEYLEALRAVSDGMAATSSSIASVSRQLDTLRAEEEACPDRELYEMLADAGEGEDVTLEIADYVKGLSSGKAVYSVTAAVMFLLAAACGVAAFLLRDRGEMIMLPLVAVAAFFAVLALVFACVAVVNGARYRRELKFYGVRSHDELLPRLMNIESEADEHGRISEQIAAAENELYVHFSVLDDERCEARELLTRCGIETDDDGLPSALAEVISSCEEAISRESDIRRALERCRGEIGKLEYELADADEAETREAVGNLDISEYDSISAADLRRERDFTENAVTRLGESISDLRVKHARLTAQRDDPLTLAVRRDALARELAEDRERLEACVLAMEALEAAGKGVRESVAPRLRELARDCMGRISDGKYTELGVDAAFGLTISADGAYRELEYMSGGTAEAAYLSLRLALVKLLYRRELPPMIFDESFAQLDDRRSGAMLSIAAGSGAQAIVLTCQSREARLAGELSVSANRLQL